MKSFCENSHAGQLVCEERVASAGDSTRRVPGARAWNVRWESDRSADVLERSPADGPHTSHGIASLRFHGPWYSMQVRVPITCMHPFPPGGGVSIPPCPTSLCIQYLECCHLAPPIPSQGRSLPLGLSADVSERYRRVSNVRDGPASLLAPQGSQGGF